MPVLTICNHKGGTGKTTSVIHLAAAFGRSGYRTLVVDLDPQGFMTRMLGASEPEPAASSLVLFQPDGDVEAVPKQAMSHFDLLPASYSMTRAQQKLQKPTDVFWLRETLAQEHSYDLIVLDTAAAITVFSMNALVAADLVVIPVTPEYQPVVGAEQTFATTELVRRKLNPNLQAPSFLLTQVDARKRDHAAYTSYLREKYRDQVLSPMIRTHAALAETARSGETVFDRDPFSRGALDYQESADRIGSLLGLEAVEPVVATDPVPEAPAPIAEPLGASAAQPQAEEVLRWL